MTKTDGFPIIKIINDSSQTNYCPKSEARLICCVKTKGNTMNSIEIKEIAKSDNWTDLEWYIDGIRLSDYLRDGKSVALPKNVEPFDDLCPAWTKRLIWSGDVRFVRYLIDLDSAIVPVYMCPDDPDFSCIVIVIEVVKTNDSVYWERAGYVSIKDYDFQEEKQCGMPLQKKQYFLGAEMFSTEVALSWMLDSLNKRLSDLEEAHLEAYYMPKAFSCDTPYFEIFTRNLFFTHKDYKLSPLDIAEKLFLLEYISLLKNNIDPSILCVVE